MTRWVIFFGLVHGVFALQASAAESDATAAPVPALYGSQAEIEARFQALRALRANPDEQKLERAFAELMQAKFAANWPNLEPFSIVLTRDAADAKQQGNAARQRRLLQYARDLSPSLLVPRLQLVLAGISAQPGDVGNHFRELLGAVRVLFSDFRTFTRLAANGATILVLAVLLAAFVVLVMLLWRQWRYVAHDVTLLMPKGSTRFLAYGLFVLLLGLPFGLRFGLLGGAFVLLLLPFIHMDMSERVIASIAFALLAASPLVLPFVVETWVHADGRAKDLYLLTRTMSAEEAQARIEKSPGVNDAIDAQLALGLYKKRKADLDGAAQHFERVVKLDQNRADAWVNLGAVRFLQNKSTEAEAAFEKALVLDPRSISALFNSSRMYYKAGDADRGTKSLGNAQQLNAERTGALAAISRMIGPRFMVEETLAAHELWNASPYASESITAMLASDALMRWLIGGLPKEYFAIAAAAFLAILWAVAMAMRRVSTALPCPRCGRPICLRTDKDLPDRSLCGQCYHAFVLADVETSMRIAKEVECRRHERRRTQLVSLMSILFAGAGHILRGRAILGAFLCGVAALAWTVALTGGDVVPMPLRYGVHQLKLPLVVTAILVWLAASVLALYSVPKKD